MKTITIEGHLRTEFGKKATRQLRSEGNVPAVIYGGAKEINFYAPSTSFRDIVYTGDFLLTEVKVDGKSYTCVMKDPQFDVVSDQLIHVDFLELVPKKKFTTQIPIKFKGTPVGVVKEGGRLVEELQTVKVRVTLEDLEEHIEVDLSHLKLHDIVRVGDLKAAKMEILNSPRIPVASVTTTRKLKVEATAAATDATATATATAGTPAAGAAATPAPAAKDAAKK